MILDFLSNHIQKPVLYWNILDILFFIFISLILLGIVARFK